MQLTEADVIDKINKIHSLSADCKKCTELSRHIQFPPHCHGNIDSGIMLISEGAYINSIKGGRYFTRGFLRDAIPDLENRCYLTDVIKCDSCGIKSKQFVQRCTDFLLLEIATLKPKAILAVGSLPFEVLTGQKGAFISKHGQRFTYYCKQFKGIEVIPLIHPSRANVYYPSPNPVNDYKNSLRKIFRSLETNNGLNTAKHA